MIFAANFKTNHTRSSTRAYIEQLGQTLASKRLEDRILIFPPATALDRYEGDVTIGVQNAYPVRNGAVTGEIGLEQIEEFGIKTILIGHSERRELLGESQETVAKKFAFFKENGFEIIYCIGEPLDVREAGEDAVKAYLFSEFEGIDLSYKKLIVAYEPIWAIGTGRSAERGEIAAVHGLLRTKLSCPLLYGGSVKPANITEITAIDNVDGVLVGSAALDVKSFSEMILK